jgi:flagellar protein FlaG
MAGGALAVAAQQEFPNERRPPLSEEQKAADRAAVEKIAADKVEVSLLGSQKIIVSDLQKTTSDLEKISLAFNRRLKFEIDHESREILIKIIDNETDKVIKVLPPEELKRLHSNIKDTIGFLFDGMV